MIEPADAPDIERSVGLSIWLLSFISDNIFIMAQLYPDWYAPRLTPPLIVIEKSIGALVSVVAVWEVDSSREVRVKSDTIYFERVFITIPLNCFGKRGEIKRKI